MLLNSYHFNACKFEAMQILANRNQACMYIYKLLLNHVSRFNVQTRTSLAGHYFQLS